MGEGREKQATARQRCVAALRERPEGMSRRELHQAVGCNLGTLRQQINRLVSDGTITITREPREYGETTVHKLVQVTTDA